MPVLKITNDAKTDLLFQVEPELQSFSLSPGDSAKLIYDYDEEPLEITLGDTTDSVFGAVIPGDGPLRIEKNGEIVVDAE